jgi:hypothetical protein
MAVVARRAVMTDTLGVTNLVVIATGIVITDIVVITDIIIDPHLIIGIIAHIRGQHILVSNLVTIPMQKDCTIVVVVDSVDCIPNLVSIVKARIIAAIAVAASFIAIVFFSALQPFSFYYFYFPFL